MAGLLAAAAFLAYLPSLQNGFVSLWDDNAYVCTNLHIRSLNPGFLKWAFFGLHVSNWQPFTWLSYAMDYAIWGPNPAGYHLTNIILHAANTFIAVVLAIRLIEVWEQRPGQPSEGLPAPEMPLFPAGPSFSDGPPFFNGTGKLMVGGVVGLLFGLHPLHVESVAWVAERKDVLCALFFLLSILAYVKHVGMRFMQSFPHPNLLPPGEGGAKRRVRVIPGLFRQPAGQYLLSLALFALALMSKPMAVSLPLVLLILDWHPLGRIGSFRSFRAAFVEKLPFIALSGGVSVLTLMAQKKGGSVSTLKGLPLLDRALVAARSLVLYLWKMVFPLNLSPLYPYPKNISFLSASFFLPVLCVLAATVFCLLAAKRQKRLWLACWGYYVITLLPVIGIVQVGRQSMADRYTYLPGLGPAIAVGVAAAWAWRKAGALKRGRVLRTSGAALALAAVISMTYLTGRQIGVWENDLVLWDYVIKKEPGKVPFAYLNRGDVFDLMGKPGKAIADYDRAIALDPFMAEAYNGRGIEFSKTGQSARAITDYARAIALKPGYADAYNDLGTEFGKEGQYGKAIAVFQKAITLKPDFYKAYYNLAKAFKETGRLDLAIKELDKAISLNPSYVYTYNELGNVFELEKRPGMALANFNKAILLSPGNAMLYVNRGGVYLASGRKRLAAADYGKACAMGDADGCRALRKSGS